MGVKSLWSLLTPVGRPVMLETIEGKALAIDSSIWIYQFQATMRDKDGRALSNAHVLGFLRRISKLLFYGIKPVFVFDGGAPVLKRTTINERKKKKSGAAASHAKLAEKLLAAQMRREALNHAQGSQNTPKHDKGKGKAPAGPVLIDEGTIYLEDLDPSLPRTPAKKESKRKPADPSSTSSKKNRFHDHDPYQLPEVNIEEAISKATRSAAPDPRLATEDELRAFIEDMRPEDFDVTSPAFRELPTEVQYEIVGDLRLKSRQTSYYRLQNMLKSAPTPLDFSKQQIKNLKQRNSLTQQLLTTTDSIGKAHISIPVRIASERNREYVLIKNEGEGGGWILGIRDDGTRAKPIEIDQESDKAVDDDSEMEMEEVDIMPETTIDPDLRDYRREMALSAIANRYTPKKLPPLTTKTIQRKLHTKPLFDLDEEEMVQSPNVASDSEDEHLAFAIQDSLDQAKSAQQGSNDPPVDLVPAIHAGSPLSAYPAPTKTPDSPRYKTMGLDDYDVFTSTRLETALSIANTTPSQKPLSRNFMASPSGFGQPILLASTAHKPPPRPAQPSILYDSDDNLRDMSTIKRPRTVMSLRDSPEKTARSLAAVSEGSSDTGDMEEILSPGLPATTSPAISCQPELATNSFTGLPEPVGPSNLKVPPVPQDQDSDEEVLTEWSRSPSPIAGPSGEVFSHPEFPPTAENWDAAQEMDSHAEEGEFARFMSQVKGKDLDDVRREIDDEIKSLHQQKKVAMRDSDDITQQMISQIMMMLRLFGIPYITAPMEAEAQCAELVSLGLVDGVITDDSDVFLFGGQRVFKNMFNQSKTVECFLLSDLGRELGLDRDTLIRLAYLLGSDYVDGLPGVGPVVAMELLKEFPGEAGLHEFKDWWLKVQTGRDKEEDNKSKFRKQFKKKFKDLYLPSEWPNPAVRDAYYHPTIDDSNEPFKWGLPDLDALRDFLREELGWHQGKVDELLLPIIQKMGKRGQAAALNKQGNLNTFFDVTPGNGTYAPRKRQAYASKRLQKVVTDFRSKQASGSSSTPVPGQSGDSDSDVEGQPKMKKAKTTRDSKDNGKGRQETNRTGRGRATRRGRGASAVGKKSKQGPTEDEGDFEDVTGDVGDGTPPPLAVQLRPRPKPKYKGA